MLARRGHPQARRSIHGLSARPMAARRLKLPPARRLAYRGCIITKIRTVLPTPPFNSQGIGTPRGQLNQTLIPANALRYHCVNSIPSDERVLEPSAKDLDYAPRRAYLGGGQRGATKNSNARLERAAPTSGGVMGGDRRLHAAGLDGVQPRATLR
jgi:hypothetical protein